jgi:nicotinate-nucleotide adenylyltransferase
LFDYAHVCAASRPGFDTAHLPPAVARAFARRSATPDQIRTTPHGLACIAANLRMAVSATEIRAALAQGDNVDALLPPAVLDYIKQHHLYENTP